jgi:hypothetical protein
MGPWESVAATGQALDRRMADLAAVVQGCGIEIRRPGGSHVYSTHPWAREAASMPARRPIEPAHVRAFLRCVNREEGMVPDVPPASPSGPLSDDEGRGYLIEFPDLPGRMSDGETIEAAITNATTPCAAGPRRCAPKAIRSPQRSRTA